MGGKKKKKIEIKTILEMLREHSTAQGNTHGPWHNKQSLRDLQG